MQPQVAAPVAAAPGLDDLESDLGLADTLPVVVLAERARRAARLAADLEVALIARAASREAKSSEPDRLLAIPKVAEVLGFTEQYVYELIRRGHLHAIRSGKYVRVSASAVDRFIRDGPNIVVDGSLYQRDNEGSGRLGAASAQDTRRLDAGGARRQGRRRAKRRRSVGAGREDRRGPDNSADTHDARVQPKA